jgi:GNAT superfamily N-acetyltransferase
MRILQIDPEDLQAITAFHRIQIEAGRTDRGDGFAAPPLERTVQALRGGSGLSVTAFLGFEGDVPVASGWCGAYGEPRWAYVVPRVLAGFRRRGYGTAMLRAIEDQEPIRGCALQSNGAWAGRHGPAGTGSAVAGFASRRGWELGRVDARSRLALPVPPDRLEAVTAARKDRRRGYLVTAWAGATPTALIDGWDALERPPSERPAALAHRQQEHPSSKRPAALAHREQERLLTDRKRAKFSAVARSPAGEVVASTFLTVGLDTSEPADQQRTFVAPGHRGRGLGLAMKVELLERLQHDRPDIGAIHTRNTMANAPILAVNDALGYVRSAYSGTFHRRRA